MKKDRTFDFDKEALEGLKVGECLEAEFTFPGDDESMRIKICKTKKGLKSEDKRWENAWKEYQRKKK